MTKPITISASKLLIQLGDGGSPEVFTAPCGLTTKGITFTKNMNDVTVPDCDDPDAAAWVERGVVSLSAAIAGNGVLAMEAQQTWLDAYESTESINVRVLLTEPTYGGAFEGEFHLSTLTENGSLGDKVQVTVALDSDGPIVWVPTVFVPDTTAPILSVPIGTATGATTATISVTTDEGNGQLYFVVDTGATPTKAQIKLGQGSTGAAANGSAGSQAISSTGFKSRNVTGLAASTAYKAFFMHEDASTNQSTVAASATFTTAAASGDTTPPVINTTTPISNAERSALNVALTANETVTWSLFGGTDQAKFEISGSTLRWFGNGVKDWATPDDSNADRSYQVIVRATDTAGNPTNKTLVVNVTNVAPTITSSNAVSVPENVQLAHTLTANETVTWTKTGGADTASFQITGSNLQWVGNGVMDFEAPLDVGAPLNQYVVTVQATGPGGLTASQTITVTVTDVAEAGTAPAAPFLILYPTPGNDSTPDFALDGDLAVNDVVRFHADTDFTFATATATTTTVTTGADAANELVFSSGAYADGTWYFRGRIERPAVPVSGWSNTVSKPIDTTAPTLTVPVGTQTGSTTANLSVTSNEGNGTLYWVVDTGATPSAAQVKLGQTSTGGVPKASGSQAVTSSGAQSTIGATGLIAATGYKVFFMHEDAATNQSAVAASATFTTAAGADTTAPTLSVPTGTQTGATTATIGVTTNEASGVLYWVVTTGATPTAAQVKLGQTSTGSAAPSSGNQAVTTTGAKTANATGLTASTAYKAFFMHEDASTNQSAVAASATFTTAAAAAGAVNSVRFDGTDDRLDLPARFTGTDEFTSYKQGIVSCWFRMRGGDGVSQRLATIGGNSGTLFAIQRMADNTISILLRDNTYTSIVSMQSTGFYTVASMSGWSHILASWNVSSGAQFLQLYIDELSVKNVATATITDGNGGFGSTEVTAISIGSYNGGGGPSQYFNGDLSELYLSIESDLGPGGNGFDISDPTNRAKFAAGGHPVSLGSNGSTPTGFQPVLYLHNPVASWQNNLGFGGGFTVIGGGITAAPTDP